MFKLLNENDMRTWKLIALLVVMCSLPGQAQFWLHVEWGAPHCRQCAWMEEALHLPPHARNDYQRIIHQYGKKIEREAHRDYRHWDRSAERIYDLRMARDGRLQRLMSPDQFRLYIHLIREVPQRVHDYRGWYANPHHPDWHPSNLCFRFEDSYWDCRWDYRNGRWSHHFDLHAWRPPHAVRPSAPRPPKPAPRPEARPPKPAPRPDAKPSRPDVQRPSRPAPSKERPQRGREQLREKKESRKESRKELRRGSTGKEKAAKRSAGRHSEA